MPTSRVIHSKRIASKLIARRSSLASRRLRLARRLELARVLAGRELPRSRARHRVALHVAVDLDLRFEVADLHLARELQLASADATGELARGLLVVGRIAVSDRRLELAV